jgi:hypothetical protein
MAVTFFVFFAGHEAVIASLANHLHLPAEDEYS